MVDVLGGVRPYVPPKLGERFIVQGEDADMGTLFSSEVVTFLLRRPDVVVEGGARQFAMYRDRQGLAAEEVPAFLEEALELVAKLYDRRSAGHDRPPAAEPEELVVAG